MKFFIQTRAAYNDFKKRYKSIIYSIAPPGYNEDIDFEDQYGLEELSNEHRSNLLPIFDEEYNDLIENQKFFWGCYSSVYQDSFNDRKASFKDKFIDSLDIDFIKYEANSLCEDYPNFYGFLYNYDLDIFKKIEFSRKRKQDFLVSEASKLGWELFFSFDMETSRYYPVFESKKIVEPQIKSIEISHRLKWSGTLLEISELLKALIEGNKFVGYTDKQVFASFSSFLDINSLDLKKKDKLATIRQRTIDKTPFLNQLQIELENWIDEKDKD